MHIPVWLFSTHCTRCQYKKTCHLGPDQKTTWLRVKAAQSDWVILRGAGVTCAARRTMLWVAEHDDQ
jgi:hypothetical protein